MTIRTLFNIIIKIFGLLFFLNVIDLIPTLISIFSAYTAKYNISDMETYAVIEITLLLVLYIVLVYLSFFKTNIIIDKLKLDKGFEQESFSFEISTTTIFTIALVIVGLFIVANEIPNLFRNLYVYVQTKREIEMYSLKKADIYILNFKNYYRLINYWRT